MFGDTVSSITSMLPEWVPWKKRSTVSRLRSLWLLTMWFSLQIE
jgi:hypothetical protein